jgi:hypothetical protein
MKRLFAVDSMFEIRTARVETAHEPGMGTFAIVYFVISVGSPLLAFSELMYAGEP